VKLTKERKKYFSPDILERIRENLGDRHFELVEWGELHRGVFVGVYHRFNVVKAYRGESEVFSSLIPSNQIASEVANGWLESFRRKRKRK